VKSIKHYPQLETFKIYLEFQIDRPKCLKAIKSYLEGKLRLTYKANDICQCRCCQIPNNNFKYKQFAVQIIKFGNPSQISEFYAVHLLKILDENPWNVPENRYI
jgi:hypothetical protein